MRILKIVAEGFEPQPIENKGLARTGREGENPRLLTTQVGEHIHFASFLALQNQTEADQLNTSLGPNVSTTGAQWNGNLLTFFSCSNHSMYPSQPSKSFDAFSKARSGAEDIHIVNDAWPLLPNSIKAGILAMVKSMIAIK